MLRAGLNRIARSASCFLECVGCLRENSCKWPQRGDQPTFRVLKLPVQKGISDERLFLVFELQDKHGVTCSVVEICGLVLPVTNC